VTEAPRTQEQQDLHRRTFLAQVIGALGAFLAAVVGIPALGAAIGPALKADEPTWYPLGQASSYPTGTPTSVSISVPQTDGWIQTTGVHGVWVVRQSDDQFTVFNGRCTHLGCAYSWQTDQHEFACPCHAGVYGVEGAVLAGPPPRALDTLPVRVQDGVVQVQYQDYQLGIPAKVPA
jgi:menaquinol-cytochrome c reductase iron-sulfur subunit